MSDKVNLIAQINSFMKAVPSGAIGVAVSGGGDSIALLRLLCEWGQENGRKLYAATVNHNLRRQAEAEAAFVSTLCDALGVPHSVLSWDDWDKQGNLQNAARNARKTLLTTWAQNLDLTAIAVGHTQDDQAETFLMRLARGSGVDGLCGMQYIRGDNPVWLRPVLDVPGQALRNYLSDIGQDWMEDPSNLDEKFDRIKMRKALPVLTELGLTSERLARTAHGLHAPRVALEVITQDAARKCCQPSVFGTVDIDMKGLQAHPLDIQYRVLSYAMGWVTGADYRPRFSALKSIYALLGQEKSQTLAGCYIKSQASKNSIVMREVASMASVALKNGVYDGRWDVRCDQEIENARMGPLGEKGLLQLKNWRELGVLRDILLQTPAVWLDETVLCAPLAGLDGSVQISLKTDLNQFYLDIVSH